MTSLKSAGLRLISSKYFQLGLGIIISGLSLYLALANVSLQEMGASLRQVVPTYLGLALSSVAVNMFSKGFRWRVLLGQTGQRVKFLKILRAMFVGQMFNLIFPGRVGDLSRAQMVGRLDGGRVFVLGTVALEKILDMLSYALLFITILILIPLPAWMGQSAYILTGIALVLGLTTFVAANQQYRVTRVLEKSLNRLPLPRKEQFKRYIRSGFSSLNTLQSRGDILKLVGWSALIWLTAILNNHLLMWAMNIHLPLTASILLLIILQAGISIPSVPGRIGVFEYLCVLTLSLFGIEQATALSYGILLHSITLIPQLLVGLSFFWLSGLPGEKIYIEAN